jgi:serine phosphatase RsbU (regulator of sigma subunit)/anti-sigma regulatory factor (Ser/Thr protein kinase)
MSEERIDQKILVVDDEKLVRMTISAKLKRAGFDCVAVGDVESAMSAIQDNPKAFGAVISDISMGGIDGFAFRDIIRGIEPKLPIFFLTAMDPEEGGGFLSRILEDPISYYLPKSVSTDVLVNRVRQLVSLRRFGMFIARKLEEDKESLRLAAHIQRSLLPQRSAMSDRAFFTTYWRPAEIVSGDLFEAVQIGGDDYLYILGDIQGHGTGAALAMTAVQSFLKQMTHNVSMLYMGVTGVANMLQRFFRSNLTDVTYMTALICIHKMSSGEVEWISCGAPDLKIIEDDKFIDANPNHCGGMPIGLMPDTVYSISDVVKVKLSANAVCIASTDGIVDLSREEDVNDRLPESLIDDITTAAVSDMRESGSIMVMPVNIVNTCTSHGYSKFQDDVTLLVFGPRTRVKGIYEATIPILPEQIDKGSQNMGDWCRREGWDDSVTSLVQLVLEEKLMNVHDHGFSNHDSLRETASVRLLRRGDKAELSVWEYGSPEPSIQVVAGDASTYFENANKAMRSHGRGRLMIREICDSIERERILDLNATTYFIPFGKKQDN